jgi:hypothetical protein
MSWGLHAVIINKNEIKSLPKAREESQKFIKNDK